MINDIVITNIIARAAQLNLIRVSPEVDKNNLLQVLDSENSIDINYLLNLNQEDFIKDYLAIMDFQYLKNPLVLKSMKVEYRLVHKINNHFLKDFVYSDIEERIIREMCGKFISTMPIEKLKTLFNLIEINGKGPKPKEEFLHFYRESQQRNERIYLLSITI